MIWIGADPGTPVTLVAVGDEHFRVFEEHEIATLERSGKTKRWVNNPTLLASALRPYAALNSTLVVERVSAMPKQGISSSVRFVGSMYLLQGVAAGLGLPVLMVTPSVWKKNMGLTADKERSRSAAIQRWPQHSDLFKRMKDHNRAEAALLASWGFQMNEAGG